MEHAGRLEMVLEYFGLEISEMNWTLDVCEGLLGQVRSRLLAGVVPGLLGDSRSFAHDLGENEERMAD